MERICGNCVYVDRGDCNAQIVCESWESYGMEQGSESWMKHYVFDVLIKLLDERRT